MKTSKKGDYCELLVLARLISEGRSAAIPYGNQSGWDLLVENENGWSKWQIKTAYKRGGRGSIYIDCIRSGDPKSKSRSRSRGYVAGDFDFLVAVFPDTGEMWKIPAEKVIGRRCITVNSDCEFRW
jgi:hypothetical protein